MALQPSGQISTENINVELGRSSSTLWATDQRQVRQLADSVTNSLMTPSANTLPFTSFYNKSRVRQHTFTRTNTVNRIIDGGNLNARIWGNNTTYMTYAPGVDLGGFPEYSPANPPFGGLPDPYTYAYYLDSYSCDFIFNANLFNVDPTNWTVNSLSFSFNGTHSQTDDFEFYCGILSRENLNVTWYENFVDLPEKYYSGLAGPFYPTKTGGNYTCTVPYSTSNSWVQRQIPTNNVTNIGNLATGIKNSGTNFTLGIICRIFAFPGSYPSVTINNNINVTITTTIN